MWGLQYLSQPRFIRKACENPDEGIDRLLQVIIGRLLNDTLIRMFKTALRQLNGPAFAWSKLVNPILHAPRPCEAI